MIGTRVSLCILKFSFLKMTNTTTVCAVVQSRFWHIPLPPMWNPAYRGPFFPLPIPRHGWPFPNCNDHGTAITSSLHIPGASDLPHIGPIRSLAGATSPCIPTTFHYPFFVQNERVHQVVADAPMASSLTVPNLTPAMILRFTPTPAPAAVRALRISGCSRTT